MNIHWGVDGVTPLHSLYNGVTMLDYLEHTAGRRVEFAGRYLGSPQAYEFTTEEASFLHRRGVALLPVFNLLGPGDVAGDFASGARCAEAAIRRAQALGIPPEVALYADLETGWYPSVAWIAGWHTAMRQSAYHGAGGLYLNGMAPNHTMPYNAAYISTPAMRQTPPPLIWTSEPEPGQVMPPPVWSPAYPAANGMGTVLWQYVENVWGGIADLNQASDAGFAAMWQPRLLRHVAATCALKWQANHTCKGLQTLLAGEQVEDLRTRKRRLSVLGWTTWALVRTVDARQTTGWVDARNLKDNV